MIGFGTNAPSLEAYQAICESRCKENLDPPLDGPPSPHRAGPAPIRLEACIAPQWPPRDQFGRGTCVAFATLAAVELHRALREDMPPERLSEHFLHMRMTTAHPLPEAEALHLPNGSVLLRQALWALEADGVLRAELAPYKPFVAETDDDAAVADLLAQATPIMCRAYGTIGSPESIDPARVDPIVPGQQTAQKILDFLKQGLPVVTGVPLFTHQSGLSNWILPAALRSGVVLCPDDANAPSLIGPRADGHVVCITGFLPARSDPLGGWFIFRNSWGLDFASHSVTAAPAATAGMRGFGLLSATHINKYCWEYLVPVPEGPDRLS